MLVETIGGGEHQVIVRLDGISDWGIVLIGEGVEPNGTRCSSRGTASWLCDVIRTYRQASGLAGFAYG
jgi:hypothetical protein